VASVRRNGRDLLLALAVSAVLWVAMVPGSEVQETTIRVRVVVQDLPPGYTLQKVDPEEVLVTASGSRRTLLFTRPGDFEVDVDGILVQLGRQRFKVETSAVKHPRGITILAVQPDRINVVVAGGTHG